MRRSSTDLVTLNAVERLPREAICRLGVSLDRWRAVPDGRLGETASHLGVAKGHLLAARASLREAADVGRRLEERGRTEGFSVLTIGDPAYPRGFGDLELPPPVLYLRGSLPAAPAVAIVGSRRADGYGLEVAGLFARELAARGVVVVSGLARGVDQAAHRGALAAEGGRTMAVLGCGLAVDYPKGSARLAARIAERGAVLTEFPPDAPPFRAHFPIRNRLIAGLSAGTLVVRATPRSGSLITARLALELGRDVYAVPGNVFDDRSLGPNCLIRDGALLAQHPRDILESLPTAVQEQLAPPAATTQDPPPSDPELAGLLALLPRGETVPVETLAAQAGTPPAELLSQLLRLELGGWITRYPGPSVCRKAGGKN